MMRPLVLLLLLILPLAACHGQGARDATPTAFVSRTSTPIRGSDALFDLSTFERVYSVGGLGRIPAGLANSVLICSADARLASSVDGRTTAPYVGLSMIFGAPLQAMMIQQGDTGVAYEWWFASTEPSDNATKAGLAADFRAALRFVSGSWAMYVDSGSGWLPLPGATFAFGEHEVSARLPLDPSWNLAPPRSAYFRAVTRSDAFRVSGDNVGDVYPADLSWRKVFAY